MEFKIWLESIEDQENAFLDAILLNYPDNKSDIGVYADWLEERGDKFSEKVRSIFNGKKVRSKYDFKLQNPFVYFISYKIPRHGWFLVLNQSKLWHHIEKPYEIQLKRGQWVFLPEPSGFEIENFFIDKDALSIDYPQIKNPSIEEKREFILAL